MNNDKCGHQETQPADLLALQRLSDACLSRRLTPDECSEFQTAISSLAAHRGEVEPVAWIYEHRNYNGSCHVRDDDTWSTRVDRFEVIQGLWNRNIRPLYTHPPQEVIKDALLPQAQAGAGDAVLLPRELLDDLLARESSAYFNDECGCINHSRKAAREYESGKCPHQRLRAALEASHDPE